MCLLQEIVLMFTHLTDISYPFDYCFTDHAIINLARTEADSLSPGVRVEEGTNLLSFPC